MSPVRFWVSPLLLTNDKQFLVGLATVVRGLGLLLLRHLNNADHINLRESIGIDYGDVEACVDDLSNLERIYYPRMTEEMMKRIEMEVLGAGQ